MANATNTSKLCPVSGQSVLEEVINSLTHGVGLLLSLVGLTILVIVACLEGTVWHIVSFSIYGASLVLLYTASMLYHRAKNLVYKRTMQLIDHICIFLLIAGTYTPFALVTLKDGWGWSLFGVVWGLTLAGIILKLIFRNRYDLLSTLIYLAMGWMAVIALAPLRAHLAGSGLILLVIGGLVYSVGTVFYLWEKLPFNHALWHICVLSGSICHFFAVLFV